MEKDKFKSKIKDFYHDAAVATTQTFEEEMQVLMSYYKCAMHEIEAKFKVLNEELSLQHERNPIESIKTRLKSFPSIKEKLERKGFPLTPQSIWENLNDVAGIRVICSFIDDIYMLADCITSQDDVRVIDIKDYIKLPKDNGYRSMHIIIELPIFLCNEKRLVRTEIQLRTISMESWAKLEHRMRYKKSLPEDIFEDTHGKLLECAEIYHLLDLKMQTIRDIIEG